MSFVDDSRIPTQPYPELREVLARFVGDITAELGDNLVGIYMVGSLAIGDFDLDSDVDFLVIIQHELSEANTQHLPEIMTAIQETGSYPANHLEGSFIPLADVNDWGIVGKKDFYYFDNGSTELEKTTHDNQWHVRWVLRERGITLLGPVPQTFVQPVPAEEIANEMKTAMLRSLKDFGDEIDRPRSFWNSRFGQSFAVLTYCRMLQTLKTGTVHSKKAAAAWAKGVVEPRWVPLIEQAWQEREGVRFMEKIRQRAGQALLDETLAFIKYTVTLIE
jgi:predicted nucleotidyltransferase